MNKIRNVFSTAIIFGLISIQTGCGTIISRSVGKETHKDEETYQRETCGIPQPNMYSGTMFDVRALLAPFKCKGGGEGGLAYVLIYPFLAPVIIIDTPLSIALDTAIIPFTLYAQATEGNLAVVQKEKKMGQIQGIQRSAADGLR